MAPTSFSALINLLRSMTSCVLPVEMDEWYSGFAEADLRSLVMAYNESPHTAKGLPSVHSTVSSPVRCSVHFLVPLHLRSAHDNLNATHMDNNYHKTLAVETACLCAQLSTGELVYCIVTACMTDVREC